jgi:hypothetical protein
VKDDATEATQDDADTPEGVFGNLPSTRPGSRSPRRRSSEPEQAAEAETTDEAVAEEPPEPEQVPPTEAEPSDEPEPHQPIEDPLAPQPGIQSVEDLAWAGVAVAAQAATAGIRFTSRALEAARKSIDRP